MTTENRTPSPDDLTDPSLRSALFDFVRRRVPRSEVDDVVQTVLCEALAAPGRPSGAAELRRWLLGVARHKVVDLHRRAGRELPAELLELPAEPPPLEARALARWAERQAGGDAETLRWMAREGEGETLESIAAEERVPAPRVRQRVSRLRKWLRERFRAELAAVAALVLMGILLVRAWRRAPAEGELVVGPEPSSAPAPSSRRAPPSEPKPPSRPEPPAPAQEPSPLDRARALRGDAERACDAGSFGLCLERLDEAAKLDAAGDTTPSVLRLRKRALDGLAPRTKALPTKKGGKPPPPTEALDLKK